MRAFFIIFLVLVGLIGGLIWQIPLSFALKQSGAASSGMSWSQARGTIWRGQITEIVVQQRRYGSAEVNLRATGLLRGQLKYDTVWVSPFGNGKGNISIGKNRLNANDVSLALAMASIPDVIDEVREVDASFRVSKANIAWDYDEGCISADGALLTDFVRLIGHSYQQNWPDLTGKLECQGADLVADMTGTSALGEEFEIEFVVRALEPARYRATIRGVSPEIATALALYGFQSENGSLILRGNSVGSRTQ